MSESRQIIEYIWIGGNGELRSKTRVLKGIKTCISEIPSWDCDGSSCDYPEAYTKKSEVQLIPRKIARCPFRREWSNLLVLCDTYMDGIALISNTRYKAAEIFAQKPELDPWFGNEVEFFLRDAKSGEILAFALDIADKPVKQGQYYCSVGANNAIGRGAIEECLKNLLYADIDVSGMNGEVAPSQWEFSILAKGIDSGDQMTLTRYILMRTCEKFGLIIDLHPKPIQNWNGSGCHCNFSTLPMRTEGGLTIMEQAIEKLKSKHAEHISVYGKDIEKRLIGHHETSSITVFTSGIADRTASVRINNDVYKKGFGYFEDRRPNCNSDTYVVTSMIYKTCCLD